LIVTLHLIRLGASPFSDHIIIDHFPFVLGRSASCDHRVVHCMVSRRHAELKTEDDGVLVQDLHSSNGTYVNGLRVKEGAVVRDGDEIHLGCVSYRVALSASTN
jgi:pSer/pThr/pTyr-binding forkhead associated (FHA) protein